MNLRPIDEIMSSLILFHIGPPMAPKGERLYERREEMNTSPKTHSSGCPDYVRTKSFESIQTCVRSKSEEDFLPESA